ncbi:hypothetical protein RVR_4457 [Actinacidiphila reveromycinica]|uniref:Uncharacterized protein n=1 Tax=Actinacidiphila reveromycinica TaxID=659352 RepID=A0A7U3VP54_9ACTN|nr:hypothetical protein [Streptomyces sp. SN-593]BBA98319.1 hypothetical protein RVR_4457 [Streptomyces sp. SN-593]
MSDHAITCQHPVPTHFAMPCVRCLLSNRHSQATVLISAASGHGLAACEAHRGATATVVPEIEVDDDNALRVLFGLPELPEAAGVGRA